MYAIITLVFSHSCIDYMYIYWCKVKLFTNVHRLVGLFGSIVKSFAPVLQVHGGGEGVSVKLIFQVKIYEIVFQY